MFRKLCVVIALLIGSFQVAAQSRDNVSGTAEEFARVYVGAKQSKDKARLEALIHPKVLACRNEATRGYFDYLISKELSNSPGADYKVSAKAASDATAAIGIPQTMLEFPVQPTHEIEIDWKRGPYASTTLIRGIVKDGGRWYLVFSCPTELGMKRFNEKMAKTREQEQRAAQLLAAMEKSLKSELQELLKSGRKLDAVKRYREASGTDLTTAMQVVEMLEAGP